MNVRLVKPTSSLKDEYLSFYEDWAESQETMIPWVISRDPVDFQGMIDFLNNNEQGIDLPEGWVSDSTYWLVTEAGRIVGAISDTS